MLTVIIPALNEEDKIRQTVLNVIRSAKVAHVSPLEIIVVNDGSTDSTPQVIAALEKEFPFVCSIHNETNLGMGASFLAGVHKATYEKCTIFPGDNATTRFLMENLFSHINDAELVFSYYVNTEYRSIFRHVVSTLFCTLYALTFDIHLKYMHGSVIYPTRKIRELKLSSRGYSMLVELNMKLLRQGMTFSEVAGFMYPDTHKSSSAIRLKVLVDVIVTYLRLVCSVYIKNREKYRLKPKRRMPSFD